MKEWTMMMTMTEVLEVNYRSRFCSIFVLGFSTYQHQPSTQQWMEWTLSAYPKQVECDDWWGHRM